MNEARKKTSLSLVSYTKISWRTNSPKVFSYGIIINKISSFEINQNDLAPGMELLRKSKRSKLVFFTRSSFHMLIILMKEAQVPADIEMSRLKY